MFQRWEVQLSIKVVLNARFPSWATKEETSLLFIRKNDEDFQKIESVEDKVPLRQCHRVWCHQPSIGSSALYDTTNGLYREPSVSIWTLEKETPAKINTRWISSHLSRSSLPGERHNVHLQNKLLLNIGTKKEEVMCFSEEAAAVQSTSGTKRRRLT